MPTTDEILDRIDFGPITAAIRAEPLVHWGYEDAAKVVWNVASRFLPGDLERYERCAGIEQHWAIELRPGRDTLAHVRDKADLAVEQYAGRLDFPGLHLIHGYADIVMQAADGVEILDWKTAGTLDKSWTDRLNDSWQWRIYCAVYAAKAFAYRGIEKSSLEPRIPGQPYDWGKAPMKELRYVPAETNTMDVLKQLSSAFVMREAVETQFPFGNWPRRMPDACRSFGQRCGYWDVCRGGAPQPEGLYRSKPFSYSGMSKFLNCPDHYRMSTATGVRETSPATDLGNAVHRGTAALYEQFNELKGVFYGKTADAREEDRELHSARDAEQDDSAAPGRDA